MRPSDIKQAMLKDVTPELREKIIQITQKQDPWTDIVERSGVIGFSKELALNCFIKSQTEDEIQTRASFWKSPFKTKIEILKI